MIGRTSGNIIAIRPLKDGVIADFEVTQSMLKYFIRRLVQRRSLFQPRVVVCVPSGVTELKKSSRRGAIHAGARDAYLIEEPMASNRCRAPPVHEPCRQFNSRHWRGTTEVAVISFRG